MINGLILSRRHWQAMRRHVVRCLPLEACGLLAGKNERVQAVFSITNVLQSPVRFRMEPKEQLRAFDRIESQGLDLIGIYHSHPVAPDTPSPTDVDEATYPVVQVIWSLREKSWQARGFWIECGHVTEVALQIDDEE